MANKVREGAGGGELLYEPYLTLCLKWKSATWHAAGVNYSPTLMSCDEYPAPSCETQVPLFHEEPRWLSSPLN